MRRVKFEEKMVFLQIIMIQQLFLLALISVILVLLGFAEMIDLDSPPYSIIDLLLWFVFVVDYGWRFFSSKAKWRFILENIFDLLAILPLNAIFTVLRLGALSSA